MNNQVHVNHKPWLKQPGELHDAKGVPIYPGDLIRSFHFRDRRRRIHYLYHTAVFVDGGMRMVPTSHLQWSKRSQGGDCLMSQDLIDDGNAEVIHGYGPGDCLDYTDRPKVKKTEEPELPQVDPEDYF